MMNKTFVNLTRHSRCDIIYSIKIRENHHAEGLFFRPKWLFGEFMFLQMLWRIANALHPNKQNGDPSPRTQLEMTERLCLLSFEK